MDWNSPLGILRRAMQIERDGYKFYNEAAERAVGERGQNMFRGLAADEEKHLRILLVEYRALESGQGWVDPTQALEKEFELDPANPDLPGEEYSRTVTYLHSGPRTVAGRGHSRPGVRYGDRATLL